MKWFAIYVHSSLQYILTEVIAVKPEPLRVIHILGFVFIIHWSLPAQINGVFSDEPLEKVVQLLEKDYDCFFSYQPQDLADILINYEARNDSLSFFLQNILNETGLSFEILDQHYVVLQKESDELPMITLCGIVEDEYSKEPLIAANIYLISNRRGIASDTDGRFNLSIKVLPEDSIAISYIGYKTQVFPISYWQKAPCPTFNLSLLDYGENMIVVTEYLTDGIGLQQEGLITQLDPKLIGALPGQVQADVLRSIQFLPGVSSPDGSAGGFNVRGGTSDQNLILWENIPVYHPAHYFEMISAFNPDIIKSVDVYRGGFGANYGGRVSSVLDMKSWTPADQEKFALGTDGMSLFTSGHLPFAKKKGSVTYSLRRSLTELWSVPAFESITRRNLQSVLAQNLDIDRLPNSIDIKDDFEFTDANFKTTYQPSAKDELTVALIYAKNKFSDLINDNQLMQDQRDTLNINNRGISVNWMHDWNSQWSSRILAVDSDFKYKYKYSIRRDGNIIPDLFGVKRSSIRERKLVFSNYNQIRDHRLELGFETTHYNVEFEFTRGTGIQNTLAEEQELNTFLHTIYANWTSPMERKFGYELGFRMTNFSLRDKFFLEPRARMWYKATRELTLSLHAGRYVQWISQLVEIEGDQATIETPVWALARTMDLPVVDAQQYQVGLIYRRNKWLFDLQMYYKRIDGISSLTTGFAEDLSQRFNVGSSEVVGLDVLIKKRWRNLQSWWSYTLAKVEYNFPTFFDEQFAAPNDQRHNFSWINRWEKGPWEVALGWKWRSGLPFSPLRDFTIRSEDDPGDNEPERYTLRPTTRQFNSDRLRSQNQLDASIQYQFKSKKTERFRTTIGCGVSNVLDENNVYSRDLFIRRRPAMEPILDAVNRKRLGFTFEFLLKLQW